MIKTKKIISVFLVALEIFLLSIAPSLAFFGDGGSPGIPSPSEIAQELEKRYHTNLESIQNQGEYLNVADTKKMAPQVMLFFSPSDPKPGEKITANAYPMYFNNPKESLYYTWYIKHSSTGGDDKKGNQDYNKDGNVNIKDYKIEAARIIANGGFDSSKADYGKVDTDKDGYESRLGGDDRRGMPSHCYAHDFQTGIDYEIVKQDTLSSNFSSLCSTGHAACMETKILNNPLEITLDEGTGGGYAFENSYQCVDIGETPYCSSKGTAICSTGEPICTTSDSELLHDGSCSDYSGSGQPSCINTGYILSPSFLCSDASFKNNHLFAQPKPKLGENSGDGSFNEKEEQFWGTNPDDPDTAGLGNADEANVIGLGTDNFTWNYQPGDKLGVAVEGTSMVPTKYSDSSSMVMWAFPKNKCDIQDTATYVTSIKGYEVKIPIAEVDFDKCFEENFVDPREGGQPTNLDVSLAYSPENPFNDPDDLEADIVSVQSSVNNAGQEASQLQYNWRIAISDTSSPDPSSWNTICEVTSSGNYNCDAISDHSHLRGIGLSSLKFKLNLDDSYFRNDTAYLRVYTEVAENFDANVTREGRSDVIIKVNSLGKKIEAWSSGIDANNLPTLKSNPANALDPSLICKEENEKITCFITKNEIVGIKLNNEDKQLQDFSWTLDGKPLTCDSSISTQCNGDKQTNVNFFPVTKGPGDTYTLGLTTNNVTTGKTLYLTKLFKVIDPFVKIISTDEGTCWPKLLGTYKDFEGKSFPDHSESVLEAFSSSDIKLKAEFHPSWIKDYSAFGWSIDGVEQESMNNSDTISFSSNEKDIGSAYNITLNASYVQPIEIRRAMKEIWNISQFNSNEENISSAVQIEITESEDTAANFQGGSKKFLASLYSHLPTQAMFLFRIILTILIIILTSGFIFSFAPRQYETNINKKKY